MKILDIRPEAAGLDDVDAAAACQNDFQVWIVVQIGDKSLHEKPRSSHVERIENRTVRRQCKQDAVGGAVRIFWGSFKVGAGGHRQDLQLPITIQVAKNRRHVGVGAVVDVWPQVLAPLETAALVEAIDFTPESHAHDFDRTVTIQVGHVG